ncbi:hypothetical protein Sjap_015079 [Stephania japonica]|uniref:Receptor-like serine/threonine-protein kinase n=1 Tax=Stephania japonica TaxID=461633 RepID=A0AAP0IKC3_9MAGN
MALLASKVLLFILCSLHCYLQISYATDTIKQGELVNLGQTIVSSNGKFELGFFSPAKNKNYYIGIWYKKISVENKTIVWVANREQAVSCSTGSACYLSISSQGSLVIRSGVSNYVALMNVSSGRNTSATLVETGNLVLRDGNSKIVWQSFDYPTDNLIPGMKLGFNVRNGITWALTSWRSSDDPSSGEYTLVPDRKSSQFFTIRRGSNKTHWTSGQWIGDSFMYVPEMRKHHTFNFSYFAFDDEKYFTYSPFNKSITSRFIMDLNGQIKHLVWVTSTQKWTPFCEQPRDECHVYGYCGAFSDCNPGALPYCQCLEGFKPSSPVGWNQQDWTNGSAEECKQACVNNCSCNAYSYTNECWIWHGNLLNIKPADYTPADYTGGDLFLRLAASDIPINQDPETRLHMEEKGRRKLKPTGADKGLDLLAFDFNTRRNTTKGELPSNIKKGMKGEAWDGKLANGQEVAVKRLSAASAQGLEEFKNEMTLIANLQHKNLVRLLGCCVENKEKILIYEYLPNKSLDLFLFAAAKRGKLDWEIRVKIIEGIAQGLLYLHQYSRLRVIHRDLKASNILLDDEMNPKISDFGMARIFGGNMSEANTNRVVGTYGYMPPEYAMQGLFSIKSDVFSFGVLLLEILSGRKNNTFHLSDSQNLIGQAWEFWTSKKGSKLIDPILGNSPPQSKALRYIHVALLCVQEQANDRPTMSDVVGMLDSELKSLPPPKEPGFTTWGSDEKKSNTDSITYSVNDVTISTIIGR